MQVVGSRGQVAERRVAAADLVASFESPVDLHLGRWDVGSAA